MGVNLLLRLFGTATFSQPWVMASLFAVFYLGLGLIALSRPVAAMVLYFGTSIMNPQASYPTLMSIPLAKISALLALVVCLVNLGRIRIRFPATLMAMTAFLVMVVVSASAALRPELADKRLEEFLKVGLMTFFTVWAIGNRKDYVFFFWGVLGSLSYNILKNLVETQTKEAWVGITGVAGWISDSNDWALALAMGLPLFYTALALYWDRGWKWRAALGLAAAGALLTLTLTYSRGGFLAALASGGIFLLMDRKRGRALVVAAVIVVVVFFYMPRSYVARVQTIFGLESTVESAWDKQVDEEQEYTGAERVFNWRIAYEIMKEYPLTGVGWGNFIKEFELRSGVKEGVVAHSTWFQVGSEAGVVGLAAYVLMVLCTLASSFRTWLRARKDRDRWREWQARAVFCGVIAFCVGGTFLSRENSELLFVYMAMAVILAALPQPERAVEASAVSRCGGGAMLAKPLTPRKESLA